MCSSISAQNSPLFDDTESAWLEGRKEITAGVMSDWPPISFLDTNNRPAGISVDYLELLNKRLKGKLIAVPAPFKVNYEKVLAGELDAIMDITQRPDREKFFDFTKPYIEIPHVIVGRKGRKFHNSEFDLIGETLALEKGFHNVTYFRTNYPGVNIKEYDSTADALDAVSKGEADAYAGNRAVVIHLMEKELLTNLRIEGKLTVPRSLLQIGVKKGNKILLGILQKALDSLTFEEERAVRKKWLEESVPSLVLTEAEKAWLSSHPVIRVTSLHERAPIEFQDNYGMPQGLTCDYLREIEKMLNIQFKITHVKNLEQMKEKILRRETDILSGVTDRNPEKYILTDSYISFPIGIFMNREFHYIDSIRELAGLRIVHTGGNKLEQYIRTELPDACIIRAGSTQDSLLKLNSGEADAMIDNILTVRYYLEKLGLRNTRLVGELPWREEICMAVRDDWPLLADILNRALNALPLSEREAIYSRWVQFRANREIDYDFFKKIIFLAISVIIIFAYWNRKLKNEILSRKKTEEELRTSRDNLKRLFEELEARTRELAEARDRAEAADKLKSSFLATMSHELRTPLNSIIGFTGILLAGLAGPLNEEQTRQLTMVKTSAAHLLSLISDVLDISKIEAGQLNLSYSVFELREVLEKVLETIRPLAEAKKLSLRVDIPEQPRKIVSDRRRLEQILLNLLSNAVKFTEKGEVVLSCRMDSHTAWFEVRDTGIGIAEKDLKNIFTPFHQVDTGIARKYEGTGLGLSITKRLVELLGGSISVSSKPGEGSVFSFNIPVERRRS